jgi:hypothetical protein
LLKDTLGGDSKIVVICNISPSNEDLVATLDTLHFAKMVADIKNDVGELRDM